MSTLNLVLLFLVSILIFLLHRRYYTKPSKNNSPPGPPRLPFIGNLHQLDPSRLHIYLWKLSQKYGPLMSLKLGSVPALVASSAKMAEEVMKNQDIMFCSRPKMVGQQKLSYNGSDIVFAPYTEEWKELRKACVFNLLSPARTRQFRPIREDEVSKMVGKIKKDAENGKVINLNQYLVTITSSMISRIAFGKGKDNEKGQEERRFDLLLKEAQAMFMGFFFEYYFPSLGWMDYVTGMRFRLQNIYNKFDSYFQELIDEHLDPNRPESMDGDFIDIMLQLRQNKTTPFDITNDHIKATLMNVFVAGTESSAIVTVWAMTNLMKNPNIMKKLQKEMRETLGGKEVVDEDDIEELPYLSAVVKETMRLQPLVPLLLPREAREKCTVDGYQVEAGTLVFVSAWAIGRDSKVWECPDEFRPERFLNSSIEMKGQDFELVPFGSGRRGCPGYTMAHLKMHLLVANLVNSFDWDLPPGMKVEDIDTESLPGLTVNKKNALQLVPRIPN